MVDLACPSCNTSDDLSIIGLEDGLLRYKCGICLSDWLQPDGPDLQQCENGDCCNWTPEGVSYCNTCILTGIPK